MQLLVILLLGLVLSDRNCTAQEDAGGGSSDGGLISTNCEESGNDSCDDCIALGCGWVNLPVGFQRCIVDCSFIADIACYSTSTYEKPCEAVAIDAANQDICSAQNESCEDCVTTVQSDGKKLCEWYGYYCGTGGCGLIGCGNSTCPESNDGVDSTNSSCREFFDTDCEECLNNKSCVWTAGQCLNSCDIQDVACYEPGQDNAATCAMVAQELADAELCSALEDCASCTAMPLSGDDTDTCQWYITTIDGTTGNGYCGTGRSCDMNGVCGTSECVVPSNGCRAYQSCEDCLETNNCVWTVDMCLDSCDLQDVSCWIPGDDNAATCDTAAKEKANMAACSPWNDCDSCTATALLDGTDTCRWYPPVDDTTSGYCGVGGFDLNGVMGIAECLDACGANVSCKTCLESNCVWTVGMCLNACDIQDVACYEPGDDNAATCAIDAKVRADTKICSPLKDCSSCTATLLSGDEIAKDTCKWYAPVDSSTSGYCGTGGCDFNGVCGTSDCPVDSNNKCESKVSCEDCLESTCVWTVAICRESCDVQDVACYKPAPDNNATCAAVAKDQADNAICSELKDCANCTATALSDDMNTTCQWFSPVDNNSTTSGYCGIGSRDMNGVYGTRDCPVQPTSPTQPIVCQENRSCKTCLDSNCVWAQNMCRQSCDIVDVSCWQPANDTEAICAAAAKENADAAICSPLNDCASCTITVLLDGVCQWYPPIDDTVSGYCGIGGCDLNGVCGVGTCSNEVASSSSLWSGWSTFLCIIVVTLFGKMASLSK